MIKRFSGQLGTAWRQQDVCTLKQIDPRYILASCTAPRLANAEGRLLRPARHLYQRPNRHSALCIAVQWHLPPTRAREPAQPRPTRLTLGVGSRVVGEGEFVGSAYMDMLWVLNIPNLS